LILTYTQNCKCNLHP